MIIAIDANSGDYAPHEIVKGALQAAQEYKVDIALVGRKSILHVLTSRHAKKLSFTIIEANEKIDPHEPPMKAVRTKLDSSVVVGINLVKEGMASAFISAGSTGAVLCAALLYLGKMEGVERPAIGSILDVTPGVPAILIDSGANADCRPGHLVQFAHLGSAYSREVIGINSPRVGLLTMGEEETKGNRLARESHELLKKTDLNFIGNVEGHDILGRKADVIVTDGFTGNIVLKTIEGMSHSWLYSLGQAGQVFSKAYSLPTRVLHRDMGMDSWTKRLDFQEHGGACLMGIKGSVIIAHGRSQAKAIKNAVGLAKRTAERSLTQTFKEGK